MNAVHHRPEPLITKKKVKVVHQTNVQSCSIKSLLQHICKINVVMAIYLSSIYYLWIEYAHFSHTQYRPKVHILHMNGFRGNQLCYVCFNVSIGKLTRSHEPPSAIAYRANKLMLRCLALSDQAEHF